jgi:electron transfer flavoprotein beta subunit
MNVIVCIKQVPDTHEVKINPKTNTIVREGIASIINPFDTYAVEEALRIRDVLGGKITALSMGIPNVIKILKYVLMLGADEAILLSDRIFAGADTLATAYTLSLGIQKIGSYDLIICGKQAIDGDTAQVGPSLAEKLGISHITYVSEIEKINKNRIRVKRLVDDGYEIVEALLPAVITVEKGINVPRLPSLKTFKAAEDKKINIWNHKDINADPSLAGLNGSPTQVVKTFTPQYKKSIQILEGTVSQQVEKLVDKLLEKGFLI